MEEVATAVGGIYCRLQMPLKLALAVRETVAGRRLGALEGGGGYTPPFQCIPGGGGTTKERAGGKKGGVETEGRQGEVRMGMERGARKGGGGKENKGMKGTWGGRMEGRRGTVQWKGNGEGRGDKREKAGNEKENGLGTGEIAGNQNKTKTKPDHQKKRDEEDKRRPRSGRQGHPLEWGVGSGGGCCPARPFCPVSSGPSLRCSPPKSPPSPQPPGLRIRTGSSCHRNRDVRGPTGPCAEARCVSPTGVQRPGSGGPLPGASPAKKKSNPPPPPHDCALMPSHKRHLPPLHGSGAWQQPAPLPERATADGPG